MIERISIAGSGNVAIHLAPALFAVGVKVVNIYSRNFQHASSLAALVGAIPVDQISLLNENADLLLIALPDMVIPEFASELKRSGNFHGIVAHTSGSQPLSVLRDLFDKAGVFYPLQSFSRFSQPDINEVPFCIEASDNELALNLSKLALRISGNVRFLDSQQRAIVHLAAVFACNFSNHMYALSADILEKEGIKADILQPLIRETANRLGELHPGMLQTGPAVRGDYQTMDFHLKLLEEFPELKSAYLLISKSIASWESKAKTRIIKT
jgi:predicted short-subunit dehydrogenase-like oxidoreductase (DUF2520 family)